MYRRISFQLGTCPQLRLAQYPPKREFWCVETTRSPRLRALLVAAAVLLMLAFAFFLSRSREPRYKGKSLGFWLDHLYQTDTGGRWRQNTNAAEAIRHIGTNALPYLLQWNAYERPRWEIKCDAMFAKITGKRRDLRQDDAVMRALAAGEACSVFGPEAIPILREALSNAPAASAQALLRLAITSIEAQARLSTGSVPALNHPAP
jgi:hypothetical protein